ncbi:hypothetical protein STANM309S_06689 [Streptomyces tanashiensis]
MLAGGPAGRHGRPAHRLRGLHPAAARGAALRGRSRASAGSWTRSRTSGSTRPSWASCGSAASSTSRPWSGWPAYRFSGDIWGYPEGEVYFPGSPVLRVEGSFAECVLLETVILSILNHDSAIAAASLPQPGRARPHGWRRGPRMGRWPPSRAGLGSRLWRRPRCVGGLQTRRRASRTGFRCGIPTVDKNLRPACTLRQRAGRLPRPARGPGARHDPAGRQVRRGRGRPHLNRRGRLDPSLGALGSTRRLGVGRWTPARGFAANEWAPLRSSKVGLPACDGTRVATPLLWSWKPSVRAMVKGES